jgi:hypothetical protein
MGLTDYFTGTRGSKTTGSVTKVVRSVPEPVPKKCRDNALQRATTTSTYIVLES